ncbi:hypothetical protein [Aminobacter ciceronei]|uniref:Uncharacterized protein n=1 Tax=Aminobacter ciceronei TaxID=150723 RepID=A0ABR6C495_9HYPH|nr:hypothetical protein [Aminobacter ciceronei]MBA8905787.1 hypothetical protein [Aminobacter ciceronei]MBA9019566.1 hypothetical protein [Aminobacter ciceronei]
MSGTFIFSIQEILGWAGIAPFLQSGVSSYRKVNRSVDHGYVTSLGLRENPEDPALSIRKVQYFQHVDQIDDNRKKLY